MRAESFASKPIVDGEGGLGDRAAQGEVSLTPTSASIVRSFHRAGRIRVPGDARSRPGVVPCVTGILLPGSMDGVALTARLRATERTKHTPIIILTACAFQSDREHAWHAGCDVFLTKPCLPNELLCEVRRLLAASKPRHHKLITTIRRFSRKAVPRAGNPAAVPRAGNRTPHCGPTALFTLADMARRMVRA